MTSDNDDGVIHLPIWVTLVPAALHADQLGWPAAVGISL